MAIASRSLALSYYQDSKREALRMTFNKTREGSRRRWFLSLLGRLASRNERFHHLCKRSVTTVSRFNVFATTRSERIKAWTASVWVCASVTGFALILNLSLLIWASTAFPSVSGISTLFEGSCSTVSSWDTWLHLLINILGTLLLGASNYTMQCLSAPDRTEVNAAHAQGKWLDIGVPSVKNLRWIDKKRVLAWTLLAFTSIPTSLM